MQTGLSLLLRPFFMHSRAAVSSVATFVPLCAPPPSPALRSPHSSLPCADLRMDTGTSQGREQEQMQIQPSGNTSLRSFLPALRTFSPDHAGDRLYFAFSPDHAGKAFARADRSAPLVLCRFAWSTSPAPPRSPPCPLPLCVVDKSGSPAPVAKSFRRWGCVCAAASERNQCSGLLYSHSSDPSKHPIKARDVPPSPLPSGECAARWGKHDA